MAKLNTYPAKFWLVFLPLITLTLLVAFSPSGTALASETGQKTEEYCLSCHGDPDLKLTLPSGEELSLFISQDVLDNSIHSPMGIECEACHTEITTYPHPKLEYETRRELSRAYYQACQKCHSDNYSETQDSMHAEIAAAGNENAPVCTDCHGSHDVRSPNEPRARISETCGKCHDTVYSQYKDSIHGAALIQDDNQDVPVCTDCHGVHSIKDPRTATFHVSTPEMCASCHSDPELMGKYGLSADVYDIYETSWHGVDVSVYQARWPNLWHNTAVCTDCHGTHDILSTDNPASRVNPTNMLATCQSCHPGVSENWTSAWTGHYEVSLERTPFVYYTEKFYTSFTPFVLILSGIYVGLQLIRAIVDRARRSLS